MGGLTRAGSRNIRLAHRISSALDPTIRLVRPATAERVAVDSSHGSFFPGRQSTPKDPCHEADVQVGVELLHRIHQQSLRQRHRQRAGVQPASWAPQPVASSSVASGAGEDWARRSLASMAASVAHSIPSWSRTHFGIYIPAVSWGAPGDAPAITLTCWPKVAAPFLSKTPKRR